MKVPCACIASSMAAASIFTVEKNGLSRESGNSWMVSRWLLGITRQCPGNKGDGREKRGRIHLRRRGDLQWDRAGFCRRHSWGRIYRLAWLRDTKAAMRKIQEKEPGRKTFPQALKRSDEASSYVGAEAPTPKFKKSP